MADEPSAPPPASPEGVQVAPPSPGKDEVVPAAAEGKKPPTKMIVTAVGGVAAVVVVVLLVMLVASLFGGGPSAPGVSPVLKGDDPKAAGKSYVSFLEEKDWSRTERARDRANDDMSFKESVESFFKDKEKYKKQLTRAKNRLKFFSDNKKDLKKFEVQDEVLTDKEGRKVYACKVKGKRMVASGDDAWKLEDREDKYEIHFTKINKQWLIHQVVDGFNQQRWGE